MADGVRQPTRSRVAKAAVGAAVLVGMSAGSVQPASAARRISTWKYINGFHLVHAQADTEGRDHDMRYWNDLRSAESTPGVDAICAWQGYLAEKHASGAGNTQYSKYHAGCNLIAAWIDWEGWRDFQMPNSSYIRAKWRSDNTPSSSWFLVGDLKG
jgi:hypothetical protein